MIRKILFWVIGSVIVHCAYSQQRVIAECTIKYALYADSTITDTQLKESIENTKKTVYIKGKMSRVDVDNPLYKQSTIYDKQTGNATILREMGNTKLVTKLNNAEYIAQYKTFSKPQFAITNETKQILGYVCKKALLSFDNQTSYTLFFTTSIIPSVKEYEWEFKDVPGFVLEYDLTDKDGKQIKYIAEKVNLSPIPINKFEYNVSAYRLYNLP